MEKKSVISLSWALPGESFIVRYFRLSCEDREEKGIFQKIEPRSSFIIRSVKDDKITLIPLNAGISREFSINRRSAKSIYVEILPKVSQNSERCGCSKSKRACH